MTPINQKEIYLLELFISPAYLAELRDTWGDMIKHIERCLGDYMTKLPPDYRRKPLPEQPDAVWEGRILPNFRESYQALCSGVIALTHGDLKSLRSANGPLNDYKGQREYSSGWMAESDAAVYFELLNRSHTIALNICATEEPYWKPGELLEHPAARGNIEIPAVLPEYRLNTKIRTPTGGSVQQAGVYLPDLENGCPQYLNCYKKAPSASVIQGVEDLLHPTTGEKYAEEPIFEKKDCLWTLVERCVTNKITINAPALDEVQHRIMGGDTCPQSGYYFTPSRPDSLNFFEQGVVMPTYDTTYGATIWQWAAQQ